MGRSEACWMTYPQMIRMYRTALAAFSWLGVFVTACATNDVGSEESWNIARRTDGSASEACSPASFRTIESVDEPTGVSWSGEEVEIWLDPTGFVDLGGDIVEAAVQAAVDA